MKQLFYFTITLLTLQLPTIVFLFFYNYNSIVNEKVFSNHFLLVFFTSLGIYSLAKLFQKTKLLKTSNILIFLWFLLSVTTYITMSIGILSWGRIPTLDILITYIKQLKTTIEILDISIFLIFLIVLTILFVIFLLYFITINFLKRHSLTNKINYTLVYLLITSISLVGISRIWLYNIIFENQTEDPFYQLIYTRENNSYSRVLLEVLGNNSNNDLIIQENNVRENYKPHATIKPRSIILITIDALRPDRMSVYGAERQTTPNLQKMMESGKIHVVQEARASCAESTCGLLSLLSGKDPQQLLENNFSLPEILGKLGYQRYFYLSGDHSNYYGLRESYGHNEVYWDGTMTTNHFVNDDYALVDAIDSLPIAGDKYYFFFIHLMSVHGIGHKDSKFEKWIPAKPIYNYSSNLSYSIDKYLNYYDNGILQADSIFHEIYNTLLNKKYIDSSSIILLTADHAESLGEHGIRAHATSPHEAEIRIPWIWVGQPFGDLTDPVIQADFAPTVLEAMGAPIPEHWHGLPLQYGTKQREFSFHVQIPFAAVVHYYEEGREKFIFNYKNKKGQFFDLKTDPKEIYPKDSKKSDLKKVLDSSGLSYLENIE